jgi:hypothetical protein
MKQKRVIVIIIVAVLAILAGITILLNNAQKNNNNGSNSEQTSISIEGRTVCLSHRNMDGPHTLECAIGLKTDDGTYYGLSGDNTLSVIDRRVRVNGALKKEVDSKYQSEGIIIVASYESLD